MAASKEREGGGGSAAERESPAVGFLRSLRRAIEEAAGRAGEEWGDRSMSPGGGVPERDTEKDDA